MPRRAREEAEGAVHHVFARGNDRQAIFRDDADRKRYLKLLGQVVEWTAWSCLAYCLMRNHLHLVIETPRANLGSGVRELHGRYGREFNDRHERVGHIFQGRYGAVRMKSDAQLWATLAYVALNPVESGLCQQPEQWRWSSHRAVVERRSPRWLDTERLLASFEALGGDPRTRYLEMIASGGLRSE